MEVPDEFRCPILQEMMTDPVLGSDGYTYERSAIMTWLARNPQSPMTRAPMTVADLRPNRALAETIRRWRPPIQPAPSAPVTEDEVYVIMPEPVFLQIQKQTVLLPPTQPRSTQPRSTQPPSTQPRSTQPRSTQPRSTQPPSTQPLSTPLRSLTPQQTEEQRMQQRKVLGFLCLLVALLVYVFFLLGSLKE